MLKSCKYCGRVHDESFVCQQKKDRSTWKKKKKYDPRNSRAWRRQREYILQRDNYICQACIRELKGTLNKIEYKDISVHHIVPISEDKNKLLDEDNLISLCRYHHEEAEKGNITRELLYEIAKEQNEK